MPKPMTFNTKRNNTKPVFWFVISYMVIIVCLFIAIITLQRIGTWQFATFNSSVYSFTGLERFSVVYPEFCLLQTSFRALYILILSDFEFFGLSVFLVYGLGFISSYINVINDFSTGIATSLVSIFSATIFAKFFNRLNFLATTAFFCFNWFRHGFFLFKKLCLEPITAHTVVGSFYNNGLIGKYQ